MSKDNIPLPFLKPISETRFLSDEYSKSVFDTGLAYHQEKDNAKGYTARCLFNGNGGNILSSKEFIETFSHIPPMFLGHDGVSCNQHYINSLLQFYANVQQAWDDHVDRTDDLIGTPSGNIKPYR